ncbi:MAG: sugar transferase [Eubacterium sp.]|jgi:lipopolysaccharide/colanic/teichoic acid biosynthesis glycosyltransferase
MIPVWEKMPREMQTETVRRYYDALRKKKGTLIAKRCFDVFASLVLIVILSPLFCVLAVMIKKDSKGPVFYRQERVTQYGRVFRVFKFRTMVQDADKIGTHVTVEGDPRITRVGAKIRDSRLDEIPQLFNILGGSMSFVGTRPEAVKYVKQYTDEMNATLLLPAGVTSEASIRFKDEAKMLDGAEDVDKAYVEKVLPQKMKYNLEYLLDCTFGGDVKLMLKTVTKVREK